MTQGKFVLKIPIRPLGDTFSILKKRIDTNEECSRGILLLSAALCNIEIYEYWR